MKETPVKPNMVSRLFFRDATQATLLRIIIPVGLTFILLVLSVYLLFVPSMEKQLMALKREMIRSLTDNVWSLLSDYDNRVKSGELTLEQAQKRAKARIKGMRYGPEQKDYFWINDMHPRMVMHPYRSDLDGEDLSGYADPNGKRLFVDFVRMVREHGSGYIDYMWQWKDDPDKVVCKISYVRGFKPWGWIVGTGIYTEDVSAEIASMTRKLLLAFLGVLAIVLAFSSYIIWQTIKFEGRRRRSEEDLRESEETFRVLGENAPFGISIMRPDRTFEYFNPKFTEILGYTMADIPDKEVWFQKAYPGLSYRKDVIKTWKEDTIGSAETGDVKPRVFTVRHKDGRDKIIHFRTVVLEDGRQFLTYEDVTDQAKAKEAIEESEHRYMNLYEKSKKSEEVYKSLLRSSADAIISYDLEGRAIYVSPAFTRIFGWKAEEVEGKQIPFVPESERERSASIIRDILDQGAHVHDVETKRLTKDGRLLDVCISASSHADHEGNPFGLLAIIRDISERKRLETQFQQALRMESIGTLAGGIAHNFNNLLMVIQGNASLMLMKTGSAHPDYKRLRNIEQSVEYGAALARELLGFARGGKYELMPINLNAIVKKGSKMFGSTKKEIAIHQKYQIGIWSVEADQGQIEQVLMNLYVNASQAMPGGGDLYLETKNETLGEAHIRPYRVAPGNYVKITVTDTGVGMDPATRQRIFDPFFTTRKVGSGTGLGLASTYGVIKNHGGIIEVNSKKGEGTTFTIYLPATGKEAMETGAQGKGRDEVVRGIETVLLVDDEDPVADVGAQMLEKMGYAVFVARAGKEALEIYGSNRDRIDIVILDMIMPHMGGGDVYDRLKEINPEIRVLLSSGYSIDGQATEILNRGCNGFIQKPFDLKDLSERIREVLDCQPKGA